MEKQQNLLLPVAIVIAAVIIGGTIYFTRKENSQNTSPIPPQQQSIKDPRPIDSNDHVLGNPDAPLTMLVYTDFECPFCKNFHETVRQIIDEYGKQGKVCVVFRHFPLDSLHKKSRKEAEGAECAASLGGNEAFWNFANKLFEQTPSNDKMDLTQLPIIAESIGLDKARFSTCLDENQFASKIQESIDDAMATGGEGTPYFIIIDKKGKKYPVTGLVPYQDLKLGLDQLLSQE